jgi:hypothetical protein
MPLKNVQAYQRANITYKRTTIYHGKNCKYAEAQASVLFKEKNEFAR